MPRINWRRDKVMKIKVGMLGCGGYVAKELIHLLLKHPNVQISSLVSESSEEGKNINSIHPELRKIIDRKTTTSIEALYDCDVIITSKPDFDSLKNVPTLYKHNIRIIDMSAAYRFHDPCVYKKTYGREHTSPELLSEAVYGLPELYRDKMKNARLVANPGCYPVSVLLGCAPLIKNHLVDPQDIIVDSYSGVSGAGSQPEPIDQYLFCELDENIMPYKVCEHRHSPEMEQELGLLAQSKALVTFVPHLAPVKWGILTSIFLKLIKPCPLEQLRRIYSDFYRDDYFVRLMGVGEAPRTRNVVGTNFCDIGLFANNSHRVIVISAIDNLIKGAAGQAIQNMNIMFGLNENTGLVDLNADINQIPNDFTIEQLIKLPSK